MLLRLTFNQQACYSPKLNLSGCCVMLFNFLFFGGMLLLSGVFSGKANANETTAIDPQHFKIHGFISQGIIDVNGSDFVNDSGDLSAELTEIGLNATYQLTDTLRVAGQVVYLDGGNRYAKGARIDYALLDWTAFTNDQWQANIYLGRFKNNHWLYSSSRDVPFARPSIILPQSVYFDGFRDIAVGSDGVASKISYSFADYGDLDWQISYGFSPISKKQTSNLLSEFAKGSAKQDYDAQTSLYWHPEFSAWRFGLSLLDAEFTYQQGMPSPENIFFDSDFTFQFYTFNALYEGESWEFSAEVYQQRFVIDGFYSTTFKLDDIGQGFYFQSRYKVSQRLTLLARYEDFYLDKDDKNGKQQEQNSNGAIPYYFGFHRDTTVGLNFDATSNMALRAEYHWIKGTGRLSPVVLPNTQLNNSETWQMWAVQLMYWF
jgi:hypothetical protein